MNICIYLFSAVLRLVLFTSFKSNFHFVAVCLATYDQDQPFGVYFQVYFSVSLVNIVICKCPWLIFFLFKFRVLTLKPAVSGWEAAYPGQVMYVSQSQNEEKFLTATVKQLVKVKKNKPYRHGEDI